MSRISFSFFFLQNDITKPKMEDKMSSNRFGIWLCGYVGMRCVARLPFLFACREDYLQYKEHGFDTLLPLFRENISYVVEGETFSHANAPRGTVNIPKNY